MSKMVAVFVLLLAACSSNAKQGEMGEPGEMGTQGDDGEPGSPGEPGDDGEVGPRGLMGEPGDDGALGASGPEGTKGAKGNRGEQGAEGPQGEQGPMGLQGMQGIQGMQGEQGLPGVPGPAGGYSLVDANDVVLGTLIGAMLPDAWWVVTDDGVILGYNFFAGGLRTLYGGPLDLFYESTDCTGTAFAFLFAEGAGIVNGGQLYKQVGAYLPLHPVNSTRAGSTGECDDNLPSTRNVAAVELVGPEPPAGAVPFRLVERE